ncbi:MAG: hypothetical protein GF411_02825 [Candidatus Lokiarchaeota archaeon]|nr:hypothetical protein [Candidatus Lokiarchaeota archaeon]
MEIEREEPLPPNPFEKNGGWYWYDEAGDYYGPYDTKREASVEMHDYAVYLDSLLENM